MSENEKKVRRSFKKRYVAIAALSALAVAGGVVGATTWTSIGTVGNEFTVSPNTGPALEVTQVPLKTNWIKGQTVKGNLDRTEVTLKNTGKTEAVVSVAALSGVKIPTTGNGYIRLDIGKEGAGSFFNQFVGGSSAGSAPGRPNGGTITLAAGASQKIWIGLDAGVSESVISDEYDKSFDVQFTLTKAGAPEAGIATDKSTLKGNQFLVGPAKAIVKATGTPFNLKWTGSQTNDVTTTYTVENTGTATATVNMLPVTGVAIPFTDKVGGKAYLKGVATINGKPVQVINQEIQKDNVVAGTPSPFDVPAGGKVVVTMTISRGLSAATVAQDYSASFDAKFNFITKK